MAIREKHIDGKTYYDVSIGLRSKHRRELRVQKMRSQISSLRAAQTIEKELIKECAKELSRLEGKGKSWCEALDEFTNAYREGSTLLRPMQANHVTEMVATLKKFTEPWLNRPCEEISSAEVRQVLSKMEADDYSNSRMRAVKSGINTVFTWGIESGELKGILHSPAQMVVLKRPKSEKPPPILTLTQVQYLIARARSADHPWYPIWYFALNSGMRSGELFALEWGDIDFGRRSIMVSKSYNNRLKITKSTKGGYWRTVPMNQDLYEFLHELKARKLDEKFVLPRVSRWSNGEQAKFLRGFCAEIQIPEVPFHALRACFATHLLNAGVEAPKVRKICGWTSEKVMAIYLRLAGVEVSGATDRLEFSNFKGLTDGPEVKEVSLVPLE